MDDRHDERRESERPTGGRRWFLTAVGATSAVALAGCQGESDGTPQRTAEPSPTESRTASGDTVESVEPVALSAAGLGELALAEVTRETITFDLPETGEGN